MTASCDPRASRPGRPSRRSSRGAVFIGSVMLMMGLGMLAMLLTLRSTSVVQRTERREIDVRLSAAGDAVLDLRVLSLWNEYSASRAGAPSSLKTFREWLDGKSLYAQSLDGFRNAGFAVPATSTWLDVLPTATLPKNPLGKPSLDGACVQSLRLLRDDSAKGTVLRMQASLAFGATTASQTKTVERLYHVQPDKFNGFSFALLARNINCIMCHLQVDSSARWYNREPALYGSFPRVRVGTLQSLKIRDGAADSQIVGSLYTRGPLMDKDGTLLPDLVGSSLESAAFDSDWKVKQLLTGAIVTTQFANATGSPLPKAQNLYLGYPTVEKDETDGVMPTTFPPVIPDDNGNRTVDGAEFAKATAEYKGKITGGYKRVVSSGGTYPGSTLPSSDVAGALSATVSGHLVLNGTAANPIVIDGKIAVDGDVVINGYVKGTGTILARNNVYLAGDVKYADGVDAKGNRTFGLATGGTSNRLLIGAGGNVLGGDFLSDGGKAPTVTGLDTGIFNFCCSEVTLFNQLEWTYTQKKLPDSRGTPKQNPLYDPTYVPRYYNFYASNPVAIFNKNSTYFNAATGTWLGKEHVTGWSDDLTYLPPGSTGGGVVSLTPEGGWLTATQLLSLWNSSATAHGSSGPMAIDAFLYTNNSIMLMVPKSSNYDGMAIVNGGIVAADVGILVAGGLQLNYDDRQRDVIQLPEADGDFQIVRGMRIR